MAAAGRTHQVEVGKPEQHGLQVRHTQEGNAYELLRIPALEDAVASEGDVRQPYKPKRCAVTAQPGVLPDGDEKKHHPQQEQSYQQHIV